MGRVEFALPDVGEGLEEGEVVAWLVAPGDSVARDQPLVEVQTDKALVELPAPVGGTVVSLAFQPGDIVKVGQVLLVIDDSSSSRMPAGSPPAPAGPVPTKASPATSPPAAPPRPSGRAKAAPAVRKLAVELGVDLNQVAGTGPGGRVLAADVQAAVHPTPAPAPVEGQGLGYLAPGRHPLRGVRRVTADAMGTSWAEIPHITTMDEIDASGLLAARKRLGQAGVDTTIGALLVAAVARGLRRFPLFNASLENRDIVVHPDVNVGLAVATDDGLVVPVIRRADRRALPDLAGEVRRLTAAARNRTVEVAELRGGTFTISNYGALGGRFATPLIRPGEVGILGFGAIRERPLVVDGEVRARPTLPWSLSADHRLIDGDLATAFGEYTTGLLADPLALLAELLVAGG